jgi:hypothetical protein
MGVLGLWIAVLTIIAHSWSKFRRLSIGWTVASGAFALMALPKASLDLEILSLNPVMFITQAAAAWGLFFGLYYLFSGRRPPVASDEAISEEAAAEMITKGYKLSLSQAADAISVTRGTLREYIEAGRVKTNVDGTVDIAELARAGFVIRKRPRGVA